MAEGQLVSRASSATLDLVARDKQFQSVAARVKRTMLSVRNGMRRVSQAARRVFLVGTGAVAAVAVTAASFEKRMARVAAITQATEREMMELTATAREMGKSTVFSANQAAEAMGFFAQAGFETQKIMASLAPTLNLAAAGQLDIARAADLVTNIMSGMGIGVERLDATVDQLTKTFTSSNTSLEQLADAMKMVGPIASSAGMSLATTAASVGKLSDAGLQATMAGTGLRMILLQLQDPNTEGQMNALGVAVRDAAGNMLSFTTIIDNMSRALDRLDPRKQAELLGLFGARAGPALRVLLRIGGTELRKFTKEIENSGGIADKVAKTQLDTLHGSFLLLKSAAQEFALVLGDTIVPIIRDTTDWVRAMIDRINSWSKETGVAIAKTVLWTTGLAGLLAVGTAVSAMLLSMTANLMTLGITLAATKVALLAVFGNPVVLAITAVAVAIGAVALAAKNTVDELEDQLERISKASEKTAENFRKLNESREVKPAKGDARDDVDEELAQAQARAKILRKFLKDEQKAQQELAEKELQTGAKGRFAKRLSLGMARVPEEELLGFGQRKAQLEASSRVQDKLSKQLIEQLRLIKELEAAKAKADRERPGFEFQRGRAEFFERAASKALDTKIAEEKERNKAFREGGLDQPRFTKEQLASRKSAREAVNERLKGLQQEADILTGRTTAVDLDKEALRKAGVSDDQLAEIERRIIKVESLRKTKAEEEQREAEAREVAVTGVEGLKAAFRRIQAATLQRERGQQNLAKANTNANKATADWAPRLHSVLEEIREKVGVPEFT